MRSTLHRQTNHRLIQRRRSCLSTRAARSKSQELAEPALPAWEWKKILVPIDFSEASLRTLRFAARLATQFGASLSLVHVQERTSLATDLRAGSGGLLREEVANLGVRVLTNLRHRELGPNFPGETLVRTGEVARALGQAAQELGVDLIVIATPELRRLRRALFVPMAERVARVAPCPVLTVNEKLLSKRASAVADLFSCHPNPESCVSSHLVAFRRWAGELFWRMATNRYVFYGSLLLAASLVVGAITQEHEELWRTAAALGIATVVIGLLHALLDTRSARETLLPHGKRRAKKH
jgi:nucleotide-binding universal stress UspA family protein